ncbi:MAG: S-layer homology domain-containing protein [Clostridia bacterium]|nr:S-layer homology domain-containing protein [Clostridia bacterium]
MKNLKRLIALVAVFALALTTIASAASFTDVAEDSAYYKAVEQLHKIGIIDGYTDGTFGAEKTVTRSEMAKLIAAMQGYAESAAGKAVTKFSDVPSTHWASGYIAAATGVAIDGRPDGTFAPEEEVKYEDAVKMIMATLGYTVVANANGGYPMGYVSAAIKEGVTEDVVKAAVGTPASRGTIAQLIYNAIDTPLVEQITWNLDGSGDFIKYDGESKYAGEGVEYKTLMTENLGIVKGEGVIATTNFYGFTADNSIDKEDDLAVDFTGLDNKYLWGATVSEFPGDGVLVADSGAENFLGKAVEFFAYEDKYDNWTLLSVVADEAYNKTVTFPISALDVAKTDADALYYYKDGAKTSTKLAIDNETTDDPKAMVMNNNIAGDITDLTGLVSVATETGFVTVIDNDKDAAFDAVIIETAVSGVVDGIEDGVIILKEDVGVAEIDTDDDALLVKFVKDGAEVEADAIAEGDVLSLVFADGYAGYLVADVMQNTIEGTLTSTKASDSSIGGTAYKVDGKWYDSAIGALDIKVGDAAKFYIDKFGRIAYVDETVSVSGNYAYIYAVDYEAAEGFKAATFTFQMLTKDGVKEIEAANSFTVNGDKVVVKDITVSGSDIDYVYDVDGTEDDYTVALDTLVGKMVDLTVVSDEVKKIVVEDADDDILAKEGTFTGAADEIYVAEDLEVDNVTFDADTVVYFVEEDGGEIDKAASYVGTLADIETGSVITGAYYSNKKVAEDANILVAFGLGLDINAASGLAVITDIVDSSNADEESIFEMTALYNGEEVALTTTAAVYADYEDALEIGDIVKIKVNGSKVVTALDIVTDDVNDRAAGETVSATIDYSFSAPEVIAKGYATAINKTSKKITVAGETYSLSKFDNIYVIDKTGRKIEVKKGSAASFKLDERLYDAEYASKKIYVDDVELGTVSAKADNVADYAIIRNYDDGEALELVIVKGATYTIKSN